VAVVADVEDWVVGQTTHGSLGVGVVGDVDPQGGAAIPGIAEVQVDGVGVVGEAAHDPADQAPLARNRSWSSRIYWLV
jgi:hypothetical protein